MPKRGQHPPSEKTEQAKERGKVVARGGKTRALRPRTGRSGSRSNADSGSRGH
jgi:hypothetical protein